MYIDMIFLELFDFLLEDFDIVESCPPEETLEGYIKYLEENDDELPKNYYQRRKALW